LPLKNPDNRGRTNKTMVKEMEKGPSRKRNGQHKKNQKKTIGKRRKAKAPYRRLGNGVRKKGRGVPKKGEIKRGGTLNHNTRTEGSGELKKMSLHLGRQTCGKGGGVVKTT